MPWIWTSLKICRLVKGYLLLDGNNLDWSKLKVASDNRFNVTQVMKFVINWAKKEEIAVTNLFSFSNNVFKSFLHLRSVKELNVW